MVTKNFKTELIKDMKKILNVDGLGNVSTAHIIEMYCWLLTERKELPEETKANGTDQKSVNKYAKYKGCDYWTKDAFDQCFEEKDNVFMFNGNKSLSGLRHEHVVPRNLFIKYINDCIDNKNEIDEAKIDKYFIGCVVTKKQAEEIDSKYKEKMPNGENFEAINDNNLWSRYTEMGITNIYEIEWEINNKSWTINKATLKELKK